MLSKGWMDDLSSASILVWCKYVGVSCSAVALEIAASSITLEIESISSQSLFACFVYDCRDLT